MTAPTHLGRLYARMSKIGTALPTHWAYGDWSEGVEEGAQLLAPHQAAHTVVGGDVDGVYSPEEGYTTVLVVIASETVDGGGDGGCFVAALPEHVRWVGAVPAERFAAWVCERAAEDADDPDDVDPEEWAVWADEDEIEAWLAANAVEVAVEWVDTRNL